MAAGVRLGSCFPWSNVYRQLFLKPNGSTVNIPNSLQVQRCEHTAKYCTSCKARYLHRSLLIQCSINSGKASIPFQRAMSETMKSGLLLWKGQKSGRSSPQETKATTGALPDTFLIGVPVTEYRFLSFHNYFMCMCGLPAEYLMPTEEGTSTSELEL